MIHCDSDDLFLLHLHFVLCWYFVAVGVLIYQVYLLVNELHTLLEQNIVWVVAQLFQQKLNDSLFL